MSSAAAPTKGHSALAVIARAGLLAGVLDIAYVFLYFGLRGVPVASGYRTVPPEAILKNIAAALLGRESAASGGWPVALLGLAMHFGVALAVAAVFYVASRKLVFLTRWILLSGVAYGAVVWLAMYLLVLPLTANPPKSFPPSGWVVILVAHLVCVGPPIAWVVGRAARTK